MYFDDNKRSWDQRADLHVESDFYDVERFKQGRDSLQEPEKLILDQLDFKDVLHLQCHFGLDTLSLAHRYGAAVTGVDFSPRALRHARQLATELSQPARWVECNILHLDRHVEEQFDLVFASYGVIGWFPDVGSWMQQAAKRLSPGGHLVLVEFHPFVWMFDHALESITHPYFNRGVITEERKGSYAAPDAEVSLVEHGWNHPIADVISAGLSNGLELCSLREYDYSPYEIFHPMRRVAHGYVHARHQDRIPYVYSLVMRHA